jgi:hypothetical protein
MKQFSCSLIACIIFYIIGSAMAAHFDVTKWTDEGRFCFCFSLFMSWFVPILCNIIIGESNFSE